MRVQLPPLAALQAFEAAGRRMSFRQAAEELNVTPSAISPESGRSKSIWRFVSFGACIGA